MELGVTVSVGLSWNKIFAKFGSDHDKPNGLMHITPQNAQEVVWPAPVQDLLYVGPATSRKLHHLGITTIGQLAQADEELIRRVLGKMGTVVQSFARGEDDSAVRPLDLSKHDINHEVKGVGNGITCPFDVEDERSARQVVWLMGESVAQRLRARRLKMRGILLIEKNDMAASQSFFPVERGIPPRVLLRNKIFFRGISLIPQTSADNLLYPAVMNVNTWPEFQLFLLACP